MVSTIARLDPRKVLELSRAELPAPLDVLNLIDLRDERSYARYALAVAPAMAATGARLQWMGRHERTILGEPQAERLMVVRYPSHRRFLAMTLNPYYFAINGFRERGVRRFEAAFTEPYLRHRPLAGERWLVFAHFSAPTALSEIRQALEPVLGPPVYAARQVASASFLRGHRPTDPNPLTLEQIVAFAADPEVELEPPAVEHAAIHLYARSSPRALLAKAR